MVGYTNKKDMYVTGPPLYFSGHERLFRSLPACTENGVAARYVKDVLFT